MNMRIVEAQGYSKEKAFIETGIRRKFRQI